uniref:Cortactin-binding protein 2 n=1 Tax=Biomphalaria glabrata TaxID=6526 RepID=A0A2C9JCT3_BIOGL
MSKISLLTLQKMRQPSPDWSKSDLLRLLSYFEGELQARDVAIATLKAEKAKQLLYQAKYGRFGLGDPFIALQRDAEGKNDTGFDEAAIKSMYDNQLAQLENLIATQRKAQLKMREQLGNSEKRFHKLCTELEEEKQKHAQDTAQGDDVTYMLEKERERLKAEIDFEKSQNKKLEKDLKKALASLEEEKANAARHKQVAIMLIKERKNLIERIVAENHLRDEMENALTDGKSKIQSMAEGLAQESKKSLKMEVALDKQSCKFDTEREALRLRLQEEEKQTNMLRAEVACLSKQLESLQLQIRNSTSSPIASQLRSSVSPARTTNSSSARSTPLTGGVLSASAGLASQSVSSGPNTPPPQGYSPQPSSVASSVRPGANLYPAHGLTKVYTSPPGSKGAEGIRMNSSSPEKETYKPDVSPVGNVIRRNTGQVGMRLGTVGTIERLEVDVGSGSRMVNILPSSSVTTHGAGKISFHVASSGSQNSGQTPMRKTAAFSPTNTSAVGRGVPPPLPPNKPNFVSPSSSTSKPCPPPKVSVLQTSGQDHHYSSPAGKTTAQQSQRSVQIPVTVVGGSNQPSPSGSVASVRTQVRETSPSAVRKSSQPLVVVSTPSQHPSCAATSVAATSSSSSHLEFLGLEMASLQNVLATMMSGKTSACNTHVNRPGTLSLLTSNSSSHSSKPMATETSLARNKQNLNGDSFSVENTNSLSFTTDTQIKIRTQNFSSANSYTEQNIPLSEVTCNTTDYNIPHHVQNDYLEPVQQNVSLSSSTSYTTGGYQSQPQPVINVPPSSTFRNIPRSRSPTKSRTSSFQKLSVPCKPSHSTFSSLSHSVEDPPVHQLSTKGDASALEQLLCSCPSSVNMVVKDNSTALHRAAEQDQDICLKLLLEKGAKPDCFRDDQMTPLHIAALKGYAKCVEVLLTNGAQVNLLAQKKQTALHLAIKGGHAECCDMLIRYNADILLTDQAGLTSVHYAVQNNHSHILKPLLNKLGLSQSKDSDIGYQLMSITDNDGWTVAHMAAYLPKPDCLIILAESMGLDLEVKDHLGRSVPAVASPACKEILSELDHFVKPLLKVNVELRYILEQKVVSNVQIGTLDVCPSMGWRYLEDRLRNTLNVYLTHLDAGLKTRRISRLDGDSDKEFSLGVGLTNITQYELGLYRWNPGVPSDTVPYTMMYNNQLRKITIIVDGLDNMSELIAFDVLQPVATINNYLRLLEQNKTVILYGPSGSGKSYLAQRLAQSIAAQEISLGRKPRINQLSLETGYPWLSFFTFLREKNCVLPMDRVNDNEAPIVVLDNLDQVDMAHMFGELLDAMEYRGAKHTFVLRDGQGESRIHYLSDHFYLIGTMNKSRSLGVDLSILPRFRWVQFRLDTEPLRGLLARHFWRRIFNIYRGQLPSPDDPVLRAIEWIICVWHRLNDSLNKLGLMEVVIGPCMFFKCPLEKQDHQIILEWMKSFWNKKIAPSVRETVKRGTGSETPPDGHNKVANTALYVLMQRSIMIGCPLAGQEKENYLAGFYGSNELDIPLKTNDRALSLSSQKRLKACSGSVSTRRWRSEIDETQTRIRGRPSKEEKETVNTNQTSNIKRRSLSESSVNKALQIEEQQGLVSPSSLHAKVAKLEVKSPKLVNIKAVFFSPSSRTPQKSDSTLSATSVHKSGRVSPLLSLVAGRHTSPQKSRSTENISSSGTYNYAKVKSPGPFSFSLSTPKSNLNIFKLLDKAYNEESLSKKLSEEMPDFSVFDQVTTPTEESSKAFYFGQKDEKNSDFSTEKSPTLKRKVDSFTASSKEENYES